MDKTILNDRNYGKYEINDDLTINIVFETGEKFENIRVPRTYKVTNGVVDGNVEPDSFTRDYVENYIKPIRCYVENGELKYLESSLTLPRKLADAP